MTRTLVALIAAAAAMTVPAMAQSPQGNPSRQEQANRPTMNLKSSQVRTIQRNLDRQGLNAGRADGVFGPETRSALMNKGQGRSMNNPNRRTARGKMHPSRRSASNRGQRNAGGRMQNNQNPGNQNPSQNPNQPQSRGSY